ncbi:MAG: primosomal protein N' [Planctomycetes bacterium]|nr:primosomal protein N' [Planctomycetota bacterium]
MSQTGSLFPIDEEAPKCEPLSGEFAHIALNRPLDCEFTYEVPSELSESALPGARVAVQFGPKREVGVVVGRDTTCDLPAGKVRPLKAVLDERPLLSAELLSLTRWMADRYACSWGEALSAVLPAGLKRERSRRVIRMIRAGQPASPEVLKELAQKSEKQHRLLRTLMEIGGAVELRELTRRLNLSDAPAQTLAKKGLVVIERVEVSSDPLTSAQSDKGRPEQLTDEQTACLERILPALDARSGKTFLLRGVTGSGKTEVYLRAIEAAVEAGKSAIVLVPEIALTPQTVGWFRSRFGEVAVLHSRMTDAQRLDAWLSVSTGEVKVVVGARSALFAPVVNLGVIVLDEEHEPSFKQGSVPRYHARDVAAERARLEGAVCILGSATPSLESRARALSGEFERIELPSRVGGKPMPDVEIVDMRLEPRSKSDSGIFSARLRALLDGCVERGEQAILFLNRRGFAPVLYCSSCREVVRCEQCDVSLTWHRKIDRAVCHSCCEEQRRPGVCPSCSSPSLQYLGSGSERVEQALRELMPAARVARMDSDTMHRREDYEEVLEAFGRGELDVLVGTQMIAKGLDFPRVTLVGIISADTALHLPDFRAAERTFQLLAQVAGRAGRSELGGRIVVQTEAPSHPAVIHAAAHDYDAFAQAEDEIRSALSYPPHGRLIRVVFEGEVEQAVTEAAANLAAALREALEDSGAIVLGPALAPFALLRGRHRHHLMVKVPNDEAVRRATEALKRLAAAEKSVAVKVDVDAVSML